MILDCYSVLKMIEPRPAMWTGDWSLKSICTYVSGYSHALRDLGCVTVDQDPFFDWIANKLGYYESTAGWANMILAVSMGFDSEEIDWNEFLVLDISDSDHKKSLRLFYVLLEEYRIEMIKKAE